MAELDKDEILADAILDAATPKAATESTFPEFPAKKVVPKKAPPKKVTPVAKKEIVEEKVATPKKIPAPNNSNELVKKSWQKINTWGLGISGKIIILLIVIGVFSQIVRHF